MTVQSYLHFTRRLALKITEDDCAVAGHHAGRCQPVAKSSTTINLILTKQVIPTGKKPVSPNWVLGGVDVLIGHAILHDLTGEPVMTLPVGTFSADAVTNVGGGDHVAGAHYKNSSITSDDNARS